MKEGELRDLLDRNPQIDTELLSNAQEEAQEIQGVKRRMVNFDIIVPYASDSPSKLFDRAWANDLKTG